MKILIINKHMDDVIGGSEIQCDLIGKYLTRYGHEVIYGAVRSEREEYRTPYKVVPLRNLHFRSFRKLLTDTAPDLVYWRYNKKSLLTSVLLCGIYGIPFVFSVAHINDLKKWSSKPVHPLKRMKQLVLGRINYLGYRFVDGFIAPSEELLKLVPCPSGEMKPKQCIHNSMEPVLNGAFQWTKPYIVWASSIKKAKHPELYIEAAKRLEDQPADFLMMGKIHDSSYESIRDQHGLPNNLHYLGVKKPEEVNSVLNNALFLVHTCEPEGFCNNFIQSWMQGKPTVSLFFDPDRSIGENRIGFFSKTLDGMCEDIRRLIRDEALRKEMGERARSFAEKTFHPETNMRKFEAFFKTVLNRRKFRNRSPQSTQRAQRKI